LGLAVLVVLAEGATLVLMGYPRFWGRLQYALAVVAVAGLIIKEGLLVALVVLVAVDLVVVNPQLLLAVVLVLLGRAITAVTVSTELAVTLAVAVVLVKLVNQAQTTVVITEVGAETG
jgi:hypothetical protein